MIKYFEELEQGSWPWLMARCGLLTASEMKLIITPSTMKIAKNEKTRAHAFELAAQRITGFVEPSYVSDDMLRGTLDEMEAKDVYETYYDSIKEVGFVTNDRLGFTLGYSPDALVGDDGLIEIKSRRQKFQVETIIEDEVPKEYMMQIQTGLLVTDRKWCDFVSYCAGYPMYVKRVEPDLEMQQCIIEAAKAFEDNIVELVQTYNDNTKKNDFPMTERKPIEEESDE